MFSSHENNGIHRTDIDHKLNEILVAAEAQHPFGRINFVSMQKLVFLWIIGNNGTNMEKLLTMEKHKIVEDERIINIIHSDAQKISETEVYEQFLKGIECASRNYLNVDLYQIVVCPVFLPGCFKNQEEEKRLSQAALYLQKEMAKRQRYLEWSPFLLLENERVDVSGKQIPMIVDFMETIMEEGRNNHQNCCCPCCVISDVNERGQEISEEQKAKIIVMLTVFRNTNCENVQPLDPVFHPIEELDEEYFFTARAISICEPVKSLVLNRLLAVHRFFLKGRFGQEKIFEEWKHTFFESGIWKHHLDCVAHDEEYRILTAPIYSNVPIPDAAQFVEKLKKFCETYYFQPLAANEEEMLEEWWNAFWTEYFLKAAGSVENLDNLEENCGKLLENVPDVKIRTAAGIVTSDLRRNCENWLAGILQKYQRNLVEKSFRPDGKYMKRFRMKKDWTLQVMQSLENTIRNQERCLRQTELLLNTGGGHIANPQQEAQSWLQDYVSSENRKVTEVYHIYQKFMCRIFQNKEMDMEYLENALIDVYYKLVAGSIESREDYMKTKLANLAGTDMAQLITKLGESWLYPVRLIGNKNNDSFQKLYVMGSRDNYLCRKILQQPNYQVAYKENKLDDRLEIVRISDRFSVHHILSE